MTSSDHGYRDNGEFSDPMQLLLPPQVLWANAVPLFAQIVILNNPMVRPVQRTGRPTPKGRNVITFGRQRFPFPLACWFGRSRSALPVGQSCQCATGEDSALVLGVALSGTNGPRTSSAVREPCHRYRTLRQQKRHQGVKAECRVCLVPANTSSETS
jgi:hypothetical protein